LFIQIKATQKLLAFFYIYLTCLWKHTNCYHYWNPTKM